MVNIKLYTLSTCPWCKKAKAFFAENHIDVITVDYDLCSDEDQDMIQNEVRNLTGGRISFPCAIFGDTVVIGFRPDKYRELLGLEA
ncbi:MAG: glutaredoxin family protein [Anaerolineae bacterium]